MTRMVRKQVYIEVEQDRLLKERASELGVSESELIRRSIDQVSQLQLPLDRTAWQEELAFIHDRSRIGSLGGTRKWTRQELYEERLERFSR